MNQHAKIILILIVLLALAFVGYRFMRPSGGSDNRLDAEPITDTSRWQPYEASAGYQVLQPEGFKVRTARDGAVTEFRNTSIKQDEQSAFITVEIKDNPEGLDLQAWFESRLAAGDIPAPATSTQVVRDRTVGEKPVIILIPASGSSTYFFAAGDKVAVAHEILSEPYMDGFIKSFTLD